MSDNEDEYQQVNNKKRGNRKKSSLHANQDDDFQQTQRRDEDDYTEENKKKKKKKHKSQSENDELENYRETNSYRNKAYDRNSDADNHNTYSSKGRKYSNGDDNYNSKEARKYSNGDVEMKEYMRKLDKGKQGFNVDLNEVDYVIVYKEDDDKTPGCCDCDSVEEEIEQDKLRKRFIEILQTEGKLEVIGMPTVNFKDEQFTYVLIHAPLKTLMAEAERTKLRMPLDLPVTEVPDSCSCCAPIELCMSTEDEVDFFSEPFEVGNKESFINNNNPEKFFRRSIRSLLTYNILVNLDAYLSDDDKYEARLQRKGDDDEVTIHHHKKGLLYMIHNDVFTDSFVLHDVPATWDDQESKQSSVEEADVRQKKIREKTERELLYDKWMQICKFMPLWSIRNYLGEKIAFYFAWVGLLMVSLWIPMFFGLGIFGYGVWRSVVYGNNTVSFNSNSTLIGSGKQLVTFGMSTLKEACDNDLTPYYALVICIWGTIFVELWKRKNATLACEWDVDSYETNEVDRPEFHGVDIKNPIDPDEKVTYYPMYKRVLRYVISFSVLCFMIAIVFMMTALVVLYRVYMQVTYCAQWDPIVCLIVSTVCASVINSVVIIILGIVYQKLAVVFTNVENHQKQHHYNDSLILKLFAFQFANCYTTCFYIAFFITNQGPDGLFGLGARYHDVCDDNNCMAMLTLQLLILMIMKPVTKFVTDIILPWVLGLLSKILQRCHKNSVNPNEAMAKLTPSEQFLEQTRQSPDPGVFPEDCTLGEYMEKILLYGYLMLFATSFPLAPLIALITIGVDLRVDGYRLLKMYRRPVALVSQDIGTWQYILDFLNMAGVVSNAFLIAFTSRWGASYPNLSDKLWIVIGFEERHFIDKYEDRREQKKVDDAVQSAIDMRDGNAARQRKKNNRQDDDDDDARDRRRRGRNDGDHDEGQDYRRGQGYGHTLPPITSRRVPRDTRLGYERNGDTYQKEPMDDMRQQRSRDFNNDDDDEVRTTSHLYPSLSQYN